MTIVCYRDGIMAADTAVWSGEIVSGFVRKITRARNGALVGAAGGTVTCRAFLRWAEGQTSWPETYEFPCEPDEDDDFGALIVEPSGDVIFVEQNGRFGRGMASDCHAIGAAADLGLGAMLGGASAQEAVRICIERHAYAGGTVESLSLPGALLPTSLFGADLHHLRAFDAPTGPSGPLPQYGQFVEPVTLQ